MPGRAAAFFDLDGTLLLVNSARLWVSSERRLGRIRRRDLVVAGIALAGYRFGVFDVDTAMRKALSTIRGEEEETVRRRTTEWWDREVRPQLAPGAFPVLEAHRAKGEPLVLVTSSSPYASELAVRDFKLDAALSNRYEVRDGRFTGEPVLPYCYGAGKIAHAEAWAAQNDVDLAKSSFYTDSATDLPLLDRVGEPRIVNPDPRLRWTAKRRGWPVLDWR